MKPVLILPVLLLAVPFGLRAQTLTEVQRWTVPGVLPSGTAYDPITDQVWVVDPFADVITLHARDGGLVDTFPSPVSRNSFHPRILGCTVDTTTGNLWICDADDVVSEVNRSGNLTGRGFSTGPSVQRTTAIAIDATSRSLLVVDGADEQLLEFDLAGNRIAPPIDLALLGVTEPTGIAYEPGRRLILIGDSRTDQLFEIDRSGALIRIVSLRSVAPLGARLNPAGLAIDTRTASLFVADSSRTSNGRRIYELIGLWPVPSARATAYGAGCPDSGGSAPRFAVSDLPRPGTTVHLAVQTSVLANSNAAAFFLGGAMQIREPLDVLGAASCELLVQPSATRGPIALGADRRASFAIPVPVDASVSGATARFQAALFPDGPGGIVTSNGYAVSVP